MRFAFNGRFLTKKMTGQERFAFEIISHLDKICERGEFCVVTSELAKDLPCWENIEIIQTGRLKREAWEQFCLGPYLRKHHLKCVNLTTTFPLFHADVVCLHDAMIFEIGRMFMGSLYGIVGLLWKRFLFRVAKLTASKILTVSNYSRCKLNEILDIPKEKIYVVYNAWQHFKDVEADCKVFQRLPNNIHQGQYFFSLSSLTPQKNFIWIMEVAKKNPNLQFVVTGKAEGFTKLGEEQISGNLHFTGYLTDGEIKALMSGCRAFIHPAIYEGFGITPLEALSCGAELIVSTATCLPEIYENSAHYIDPYNYDVDLECLLSKPTSLASEVLGKFDWKCEAEKLLMILRND